MGIRQGFNKIRDVKIPINIILGFLSVIGVSLFLDEAVSAMWFRWVGLPLFGSIISSTLFDWISIATLSLFAIWYMCYAPPIAKRVMVIFGIYSLFYLEFRCLGSQQYHLVPFHWAVLQWAYYADIVIAAMLVTIITSLYKKNKNNQVDGQSQQKSASLYFEDIINVEDLLGHRKQANILANIITTQYAHSENAVGIAITGEWGAGKSTFLGFLHESLSDCHRIEFDPWTENSTDVVYDLLDRLEKEINKENNQLGKAFKRYADKINVTNVTGWFGLSILAIRNFFDSETNTDRRNNLKTALKRQEKPIVVFIDDSDRLPSDQFLKTISIFRGIVDFPNIVFIVAFDQQRANDKLKDYGGQDFMGKLFNVVHPLQPIDEKVILDELTRNISSILNDNTEEGKRNMISVYEAFSQISIKQYIPTLREMKRFCNTIEKDYSLIKDSETKHFLDIKQWLIVELLKYTDITLYNMIGGAPETYLEKEDQFGLNTPYYVLKDDAIFNKEASRKLLHTLFSRFRGLQNETLLISNPCYYNLYFDGIFPDNYIPSIIFSEYAILKEGSKDERRFKAESLKIFILENWPINGEANFESMISEILSTYPVELLYPLLETMVEAYKANRKVSSFREIGECDNYRKYANVIKSHQYLAALAFLKREEFCKFEGQEPADDSCILESERPLILCAIFNHHIRNWEHGGRLCSDGFLFKLLERLVSEGKHEDVIWAVADCVSAELQRYFLNVYLQKHLLDCLPYLLVGVEKNETGKKLIYANIPAFEGLFLSYQGFKRTIAKFKWDKTYNEDLLNELCRLIDLSHYITTHDEYFKIESYPLLKSYIKETQTYMVESYIESDSFWTAGDRIEEVMDYIFE